MLCVEFGSNEHTADELQFSCFEARCCTELIKLKSQSTKMLCGMFD